MYQSVVGQYFAQEYENEIMMIVNLEFPNGSTQWKNLNEANWQPVEERIDQDEKEIMIGVKTTRPLGSQSLVLLDFRSTYQPLAKTNLRPKN